VSREVRIHRAATLTVAIIVTAAVAGGYLAMRHRGDAHPSTSPTPSPLVAATATPTPRPPVLAGLAASAPAPTAAGTAAELSRSARVVARNARLVGEVIDARTGRLLWARDAATAVPPASTTKLLTAVASLDALGPAARLTTTTARVGHTVYLVGGGDPTLVRTTASFVSPAYPRPASLATLARRTATALGAIRAVRLRTDASAWSGPALAQGWKPSYVTEGDVTPPSALELDEGRVDPQDEFAARTEDPAAQAGLAFAQLLRHDGVRVLGPVTAAMAGPAATPVASVASPPIAALVQRMLTVSDDDLAEALGRAVAIHDHYPATFAGAAAAVTARIASLRIPVARVSLHDASGLSHLDRIPPRTLVALLRLVAGPAQPALRAVIEGLPIAGLTGTLATRYQTLPTLVAAGVLRAKTGTLTGVNTLSGTVVDRSGRLLLFAFMTSDAPSPWLTIPALDGLAARLARCGCGAA
jgi:serine-type D-Ala-D-Ala carboxypeptidase/endopeptidase (penicillin-binding protein 4)